MAEHIARRMEYPFRAAPEPSGALREACLARLDSSKGDAILERVRWR